MNARQKAKKYKQELDALRKQTIKPVIFECETRIIDSFVSKEIFSTTPADIPDEDKKRILLSKLFHDKHFLDSVKLAIDFKDLFTVGHGQMPYYIRLDIVRR